ncbi:MAG: cytosine permease [Candidatus Pelethousia sp.]|nr:cytosine permease [Candidatus Pelethousia sp.]
MNEKSKEKSYVSAEPAVKEKPVDQDYPLTHVPTSARRSFFSIAAVLLGITFFSPTMNVGAQIAAAFSFSDLLWIMLAGNLVLGIYVAINCAIGAQTGLTSAMLSRYTLGIAGSKWASLLLGGTQIGWYAYVSAYMGQMYAVAFNLPNAHLWFTLFWAVVFGITALWGYRAIEKVAFLAVPALLLLVIFIPIVAANAAGGLNALFSVMPTAEMSVATAITAIVGTFASMGTQACNWSRFSPSVKLGFWAGFIAFMIGNTIMLFAGIVGGLAYNQSDFVVIMMGMGTMVSIFGIIILTLNIWTTAHAGAYAWGVAGAEMFNKPNKTPFLIGGLVISIILALTGFYAHLINFLVFLGIFIPPLGGAMLGDYLFTYKRKMPRVEYITFKAFRIGPVLAYVAGVIVSYISDRMGFGVPPLFGIVISMLCVPLFSLVFKNDRHEVAADAEYV